MPRSCASLTTSVMSAGLITAPDGIRRRIQNDELRLRRDQTFDHLGGDAEALRFVGIEQYAVAADIADHIFEADPIGHGQNHFVAVVDENGNHVEQSVLAANRCCYFFTLVGRAEIGGMAIDDRVLQFKRAADGRVF